MEYWYGIFIYLLQQSIICRGCREFLPSHNAGKNIFNDDILTSPHQSSQQKTLSKDNRMKIHSGIELIIGQPVSCILAK